MVALVQQAGFDQRAEELIIRMLELADEGLASKDLQGWTTATNKARDALAQIIASTSAKVGLPTTVQAEARKQLTKAGVITGSSPASWGISMAATFRLAFDYPYSILLRHQAAFVS